MHLPSRSLPWGLAAFLLAHLFAAAPAAQAGQDRWTPLGIGSGFVESLAVDPTAPGVVYAAAGTAGLYRSTDAAQSWEWRGAPTVNLDSWTSVIVAPDDPQRLYATTRPTQVTSGAVFTSRDAGLHWQELFRISTGFISVAASPDGTLLAAASDSRVYRSLDAGATWSPVLAATFSSDPPLRVFFDPLAPDTAYATGREFWRSTDSGATWVRIGTWPNGEPVDNVSALAFPGTRPGFLYALMRSRLYRSEDGGLTWSGGVLLFGGYSALAVDPADPGTVYVSGSELFVSHDGGDTATKLPPPLGRSFPLPVIAVSPAAPGTLYLSVYGLGVAVSTDAGEHWTLNEQRGLSAQAAVFGPLSVLSLYAAPSGRLYQHARRDGVLFRSRDRGATWSPLAPLPTSPIYELTEEAGSPDHLWAATGDLFHSTDGGSSWSPATPGIFAYTVASPSPGVVLAAAGCGLKRSVDGGRTWTDALSCTIGVGGNQITRRIVRLGVPHGWPGAVWAEVEAEGPMILFSQNSGRTWRTLARRIGSGGSHSIAASRGVIYLNRGAALQRSSDGGATWQSFSAGGQALSVAVDAANPGIVYIATRFRGVLRSTDGGRTWSPANAGLARMGRLWIADVRTDPKVPSVAYAFPVQGGIFQARFGD